MNTMKLVRVFMMLPLALLILAQTSTAFAACSTPEECVKQGVGEVDPNNDPSKADDKVQKLINNIVDVFSLVVGIVSVIMIIFGGFRYVTSGGDSGRIASARNTILYAVIGLIIVAFAQIIVNFVINSSNK